MIKTNKNQIATPASRQGFAHIILFLILGGIVLLVVASAGAYYFLKMNGSLYNTATTPTVPTKVYTYSTPTPSPTATPSGSTDKTTDLQNNLNATTLNPVDSDLNQLDTSAKSL